MPLHAKLAAKNRKASPTTASREVELFMRVPVRLSGLSNRPRLPCAISVPVMATIPRLTVTDFEQKVVLGDTKIAEDGIVREAFPVDPKSLPRKSHQSSGRVVLGTDVRHGRSPAKSTRLLLSPTAVECRRRRRQRTIVALAESRAKLLDRTTRTFGAQLEV